MTTKISNKQFNSIEFWDKAREWSKKNTVIISEYTAPDDFKCVLEIVTKTYSGNEKGGKLNKIEKLFTLDKSL